MSDLPLNRILQVHDMILDSSVHLTNKKVFVLKGCRGDQCTLWIRCLVNIQ